MMILATLSYGYTVGVMGISAIGVFWYFTLHASSGAVVPTLLWSYSTAVGIWVTLARGGRDNSTVNTLFFHQVGCIFLMVYSYSNFELPSVEMMVPWYAVPMAIGLPIHAFMAFSTTQVEHP